MTHLVLFPCDPLLVRHVGRNSFLQFVIHPFDSSQSLVTLITLRRSIAEIPRHTEQVLSSLTLLFYKQCQLLFLFLGERNLCVGQCLCHFILQLVHGISLSKLSERRRR